MTDLHMHSSYSEDGEFTPAELVEKCSRRGITVMSITDQVIIPRNRPGNFTGRQRREGCLLPVAAIFMEKQKPLSVWVDMASCRQILHGNS